MKTLIEILVEDLPARYIDDIEVEFAKLISKYLAEHQLNIEISNTFATPRRFGLIFHSKAEIPASEIEKKGLAANIFYDKDGKLTIAGEKFLAKNSISIDDTEVRENYIYYKQKIPSKLACELIVSAILHSITNTTIPTMDWGSELKFIRPIRSVCIVSDEVSYEGREILGLPIVDFTYGHRFFGAKQIKVNAKNYFSELEKNHVIATKSSRIAKIKSIANSPIVGEIANLVEFPLVLQGEFPEEFLPPNLPQELVLLVLKNQFFIPIYENNTLTNKFYFISNLISSSPEVLDGSKKVIIPRLKDAKFFFELDKAKGLEYFANKLKEKNFFKGLGTIDDKCHRIAKGIFNFDTTQNNTLDEHKILKQVKFYKADLMSNVVFEFPEMEGKMAEYYLNDNSFANIKFIEFFDNLDNLVGFFSVGELPTSSKDPFGLKNSAKMMIDNTHMQSSIYFNIIEHYISVNNISIDTPTKDRLISFIFERIADMEAILPTALSRYTMKELNNLPQEIKTIPTEALQAIKRFYSICDSYKEKFGFTDDPAGLVISDGMILSALPTIINEINTYLDNHRVMDEKLEMTEIFLSKTYNYLEKTCINWKYLIQNYLK